MMMSLMIVPACGENRLFMHTNLRRKEADIQGKNHGGVISKGDKLGESMVYVRDQLGHSSIRITVDTYGHLVPGGNKEAVDRLDDKY